MTSEDQSERRLHALIHEAGNSAREKKAHALKKHYEKIRLIAEKSIDKSGCKKNQI